MKRYQVSAVPINGGERVTGYYLQNRVTEESELMHIVYNPDKHPSGWWSVEIDPATIEPVKVRPTIGGLLNSIAVCPNCDQDIPICIVRSKSIKYCYACGQALDWTKEESL